MNPVVCAVDDSDEARAALRVAARLAKLVEARLIVVHAEPAPTPHVHTPLDERGIGELVADEVTHVEQLLERLLLEEGIDSADARAELGVPVDRLIDIAREEHASFIVMGSRGRAGLTSTLFGSLSNELSGRAPCPVVVVPPGAELPM